MIHFDNRYFQKLSFDVKQVEQFFRSALHDFKIEMKIFFCLGIR